MSDYQAPYRDTEFVLQHLVDFDQLCESAGLDGINMELATAVLEEAGKIGSGVLAPLNWDGDQNPPKLTDAGVQQSPGFKEAYQQFAEGGWQSLVVDEEFGGQGLPNVLNTCTTEIWNSANLSFALCPLLTQGAIEAIDHHGSDELKQTYLPNMAAGSWTGTMNLTEPDAGSDLAAVKTKAERDGDVYRITGQKIFITWGDHQMSDNIIHLVLARLPDAPAGVKGISLFVVPKFLLNEQGESGEANTVKCLSLEHKLGIHASPTCVMEFDNAVGYLVGQENHGLAYMFTMMNDARQNVGLQGLSISERAYQHALQYAKDRLQGTRKDGSRIPIIEHPDVRRMLMLMKSGCEAMRAVALVAAAEKDRAKATEGDASTAHFNRLELYTPIVKGWLTEMSQELTSLGVQIHGGMGFIEETGAAQHYRDARILTIYEGTTGIQAADFIGRKTLVNQGANLALLLDEMQQIATAADDQFSALFAEALTVGQQAKDAVLSMAADDRAFAGSASVNFLMLFGYLCGGWQMVKGGRAAQAQLDAGDGDPEFLQAKVVTAQFYCEHFLPRVHACLAAVRAGSGSIMALTNDQF